MPGNPRKRLERLEQKLTEIAKRKSAVNCNCRDFTPAAVAEFFQAEMNQTCPVHGFRRLGKIQVYKVRIGPKEGGTEQSQGVPELVQEYERRLANHRQRMLEEDDPEDL
jgi:hypothetical protein